MQDNLNSGSKEEMFLGYKSIFLPCPFKLKLLDIDTLCKHFTILWIIEYLNQNYNAPYIFEHCIKTLEIKAMKQTQQWFKTNECIYKIGNLYQKYDYTSCIQQGFCSQEKLRKSNARSIYQYSWQWQRI